MSKSTTKHSGAKQLKTQAPAKKVRAIPQKCQRCAMLSAQQAQNLHGAEGDSCWNPSVCYSRRSYARHRDRRNQARSQKRCQQLEQIVVETGATTAQFFAVLLVYRQPGADTAVHAIGAEIWRGQQQVNSVQTILCGGMTPNQVHAYVAKMLSVLETNYGIKKFASLERLDPQLCPVRSSYQPAGFS